MAIVGSHLHLACTSRLSPENSLKTNSITELRQSLHPHSRVVIGSPVQKNRSSRAGHLHTTRSEVATTRQEEPLSSTSSPDSASAINPKNLSQDGMQTPLDLESRGRAENGHPFSHIEVGKRWREIQGETNWDGLLQTIDPVLRGEVIRYGEFAQATYDAFDYDTHSRFCGSCKFSKGRLLHQVGLENRGYEVTDYIYATSGRHGGLGKFFKKIDFGDTDEEELDDIWDKESNWMGFVAVASDPQEIKRLGRRDIVVVWRGTVTKLEWLDNLHDYLTPTGLDPRRAGQTGLVDLKVEAGFLQLYKSCNENSPYTTCSARRQLLHAIIRLLEKYKDDELSITVTGHSLGSALAVLSAYDIAETGVNHVSKLPDFIEKWDTPDFGRSAEEVVESQDVKTVPVTVYSFAGPRVGNDAFRDRVEELGVKVLRVVNVHDKVPQVPGLLINENLGFLETTLKSLWRWLDNNLPWTYTHIGVPLYIDNLSSPYLRKTKDPLNAHNLEGYLHILNGFHGAGRPFSATMDRDLALVNKASDFLHRRHSIPSSWWQEENKGLIRTNDGRWIPRTRDPEDFPEYSIDMKPPQSVRSI